MTQYGVDYEPKNEIEQKLYKNIERDDSKEEKFYIFKFDCKKCGYENKVGIKKETEEFECPNCHNDIPIKWGDDS